ncbi:cysteine desulfurase selenocysteine lyase-like PLP dependent transferase superfamily [Cryptosporidium sp. chipmunk genotype I]|uniref:cysteine desulfurase selenocysteine lyase-like PLP dependent transferase superfamily n=1 Tax=Cryptosporidium sp. chipmunk genotype I TaxID=1280935 RepID=UPI003519EE3D|nr:cysteine desulfurase selenocysteine lyase-like PLP dependent transferase superfamily [Cryptosporidium sp. chipmunk genotype I]
MRILFTLLLLSYFRAKLIYFCLASNFLDVNNLANSNEHEKLYSDFLKEFGNDYNKQVEEISRIELNRFKGQTYLDYTGSGLYQKSQLEEIYTDFINNAYGNAHSRNPSAELTNRKLSEARELLFNFFNISKDTHTIIFTGGATGGLKLVGEDFPWTKQSKFYYTRVNHNSVLGIREYAVSKGAEFQALSFHDVETILAQREKNYKEKKNVKNENVCLFAFPGKDNFSGEKYPLRWIKQVQKYGLSDDCDWKVILDAAAMVPNEKLDISENPADFVVISFYKMFGYPTGLGALISKTDQVNKFNKVYFGGGTVVMASCDSRWCKMRENPSAKFEDGTVSFLSIVSLKYGINKLQSIGMDRINRHISSLSLFTFKLLSQLRHFSGGNVVHFYGRFASPPNGGIINFNLLKPDGSFVHYFKVEQMASDNNIHLRTGCFCNPGACQDFLGLTLEEIQITSEVKDSCSDPAAGLAGKPLGSIRISFGYLSTFNDILTFYDFIKTNFVN